MSAWSRSCLIVGTGYIGTALAAALRAAGATVSQSSRTPSRADLTVANGPALDRVLAERAFDQVILVGQLNHAMIDWALDRIDGPRWLVLSSSQVTSSVPAPGTALALAREEVALARGACVLRPTMVFGHGGDRNISKLITLLRRWRLPLVPGSGGQLMQPVHLDDLAGLVASHLATPAAGLFGVGGDEALPVRELIATVGEIVGVKTPPIAAPDALLRFGGNFAGLLGIRSDQIARLSEDKTVDLAAAASHFRWWPAPLGLRLEQAVAEFDSRPR